MLLLFNNFSNYLALFFELLNQIYKVRSSWSDLLSLVGRIHALSFKSHTPNLSLIGLGLPTTMKQRDGLWLNKAVWPLQTHVDGKLSKTGDCGIAQLLWFMAERIIKLVITQQIWGVKTRSLWLPGAAAGLGTISLPSWEGPPVSYAWLMALMPFTVK